MSDTPAEPVIEEILEAAQNEVENLRRAIERSGNAAQKLDNINEKIQSGIETNTELAEHVVAVSSQLERLATGIQALHPDELINETREARNAIETRVLPDLSELSAAAGEHRAQTLEIPSHVDASLEKLKAELFQHANDHAAQTAVVLMQNRKLLIAAVVVSALALVMVVVSVVI